ncbi:MAG: hypothetical protein ACRCXZ_02695, partial [Patescibacteria group bacterium]
NIDTSIMHISNHPYLDRHIWVPNSNLQTFPHPFFHPSIFRNFVESKLAIRNYVTLEKSNNPLSSHQTLVLPEQGGVEYSGNYISSNCLDVFLYPEGGYKKLTVFRTGFYYIAKSAGLNKISLSVMTEDLSIVRPITAYNFSVIDIPDCSSHSEVIEFTYYCRDLIQEHLKLID